MNVTLVRIINSVFPNKKQPFALQKENLNFKNISENKQKYTGYNLISLVKHGVAKRVL